MPGLCPLAAPIARMPVRREPERAREPVTALQPEPAQP